MKKLLTTALALALATTNARAEVTLINVFEVPPDKRDAVVSAWEAARDFLSAQPGYVDTALHESLSPDDRFRLINVAKWESPSDFLAATAAMRAAGVFPPIEGLGINPALYRIIRSD